MTVMNNSLAKVFLHDIINVLESQIKFAICLESKVGSGIFCVYQCRQVGRNWGNQIESKDLSKF